MAGEGAGSDTPILAQKPATFSPPIAMQRSVWDSVTNGNFIDAKIVAFSRRSREPGRVDTPKALFVNTHVLATACSYFESTFGFSDGIQTRLNAGLPSDVEPFFDLEECDLDGDFGDPVEGEPVDLQSQTSPDASMLQRSIKTYIVKYTAHRTLHAIVWYIYSGEITFSGSGGSQDIPSASAKSVYRFADEHRMGHLKSLAYREIADSTDQLSPSEFVEEACSVFTSRYPEWRRFFVERLPPVLAGDSEAKLAFRGKLSAYFRGELPHCKEVITSSLLCLLDTSTVNNICDERVDGSNTILRVSRPWPSRTKKALRMSLDNGLFDDFEIVTPPSPAAPSYTVYLATMIVGGVFSKRGHAARLSSACELDLSPLTWQALAYYTYTNCITFQPIGSEHIEHFPVRSPSGTQFRGCPCSMKEMFRLATELRFNKLADLVTINMMSSLTPENVVEGTFSGSPLPPRVIDQGLEVICSPGARTNRRIHSQLREILEEAVSGSRLDDFDAFAACFDKLLDS